MTLDYNVLDGRHPHIGEIAFADAHFIASIQARLATHIADTKVHVTEEEKKTWNDKVSKEELDAAIGDISGNSGNPSGDTNTKLSLFENDVPFVSEYYFWRWLDENDYITGQDLINRGYVTLNQLPTSDGTIDTSLLSNYVLRSELSAYALKSDLSNYSSTTVSYLPGFDTSASLRVLGELTINGIKYNIGVPDSWFTTAGSGTGSGTSSSYVLPIATSTRLGGVKLGYNSTDTTKKRAIQGDTNGNLWVDVSGLGGSSSNTDIEIHYPYISGGYWYIWNTETNQYEKSVRAEGQDGNGILILGTYNSVSEITNPVEGGFYLIKNSDGTYRLMCYIGGKWINLQEVSGVSGLNSYVHIAWSNLDSHSDMVINPVSGASYKYMGTCVDNNETDPNYPSAYKWVYVNTPGERGKDGSAVEYIFYKTATDLSKDSNYKRYLTEPLSSSWYNSSSGPWVGANGRTGTTIAETEYVDDVVLPGFTDDYVAPDSVKQYVYVCFRRKVDVTGQPGVKKWGPFQNLQLFSQYVSAQNGAPGKTGPVVRMRGEWTNYPNPRYNNGSHLEDGFYFLDVVIYNGEYYMYDSDYNDDNSYGPYAEKPSDLGIWKKANYFDFVATKLLISENAWIKYLTNNQIYIVDNNNRPIAGLGSWAGIVSSETGSESDVVFWAGAPTDDRGDQTIASIDELSDYGVNLKTSNLYITGSGKLVSQNKVSDTVPYHMEGGDTLTNLARVTETSTSLDDSELSVNSVVKLTNPNDGSILGYSAGSTPQQTGPSVGYTANSKYIIKVPSSRSDNRIVAQCYMKEWDDYAGGWSTYYTEQLPDSFYITKQFEKIRANNDGLEKLTVYLRIDANRIVVHRKGGLSHTNPEQGTTFGQGTTFIFTWDKLNDIFNWYNENHQNS